MFQCPQKVVLDQTDHPVFSGALQCLSLSLTFFPELALVLVFVHRLGGPSVLAPRAGELAGDQRARAVVPQVVVEVPALQNLAAGVRVRACHRLLVEEPERKYHGEILSYKIM